MSGKKPVDLTKVFNDNVKTLVGGLLKLQAESDGKIEFSVRAGAGQSRMAEDGRVFIETNIPFHEPESKRYPGMVGILITKEDASIRAYKCETLSNGGSSIGLETFRQDLEIGEADIKMPRAILKSVKERAQVNGLIPKQ